MNCMADGKLRIEAVVRRVRDGRDPHARKGLLLAAAVALAACAPKGEALYERADTSITAGEFRAAVIDLKNLVKSEPDNARARALLAYALAKNGEIAAAEIELRKSRELGADEQALVAAECHILVAQARFDDVLLKCKPEAAPAAAKVDMLVAQGRALAGLDRAVEAKPLFEAAVAAAPANFDARAGLAATVQATSGVAEARAVLDQAPSGVKEKANYWIALGSLNMVAGDFAAAEAAFAQAVDRAAKGNSGEQRMVALAAKAEAQLRQAEVAKASATTEELLKLAPRSPIAKQLRARAMAAAGNLAEARTLLEEVVAALPDDYEARLMLGIVAMQQGNLGQAEMHFANVVANQPGNVRAKRLLAEAKAESQSPQKTLADLESTLDPNTADPSLLAMAGRLSLASGERARAIQYFEQAAARSDAAQPLETQLEIASGYVLAGDFDRAIELLESLPDGRVTGYQREYLLLTALLRKGDKERALAEARALTERSGDDPQVRNMVASVYAAVGQPDAGREQYAEALKLKPGDPQTLINLARLDLAEGRTADAEQHFRKVLEADPKNMLATLGVAVAAGARGDSAEAERWLQKANADHPDSVEAQLALAQFYLGSRDFAKARAVIDAAAKKSPENAALANARGLALLGLQDNTAAIASFKEATRLAPKAYGYALNLARAHLVERDLRAALEVVNGVLKDDPGYRPALALGASACLAAGENEKAAGYTERLRQAAPDSPATFRLEGDLAMAQKRYRDALVHYRKAAEKGTDRALVMATYRAAVLSGAPDPEKVVEEWVAAHPTDGDAVAVLGDALQRKGETAQVIALYERHLEKAPGNPIVLNNLAVLYDAKDDPRALELAERAYNAAPKVPAVQDTFGWALFRAGQQDRALGLLQEAAKGLPGNAEVQYHLAAALAKAGKKDDAVALLRKALEGQLPPGAKAEARKLLEQLSK
jgi:putative PEP-CTERM system TPR-repeat lipoprotein